MSLLVIGTVAFDAIETPFGKTDKIIGGAATYASISASYFKKDINLVSVVGEDFPAEMIKTFEEKGIQVYKRVGDFVISKKSNDGYQYSAQQAQG